MAIGLGLGLSLCLLRSGTALAGLAMNFAASQYALDSGLGPSLPANTTYSRTQTANTRATAQKLDGSYVMFDGDRTNKVTIFNANPTNLTGVSKGGDVASTLTLVDDSTALAVAGLSNLATSGQVYKLDNSAGVGTAFVQITGNVGNTNPHTVSMYLRSVGAPVYIGTNQAVGSAIAQSATYLRQQATVTPPNASNSAFLQVSAGGIVYFILPQLEETSYVTDPIVTIGSARTVTAAPRITDRGILREEGRSNQHTTSTGSSMLAAGASVTRGDTVIGGGFASTTAGKTFAKNTVAMGARAQVNYNSVANGTTYTTSIFLKRPASFNGEYIGFGENNAAQARVVVNPFTGVIVAQDTAVSSAFVRPMKWGDGSPGWRIEVSWVGAAVTTSATMFYPAFNTDGSLVEMSAIGTGYAHTVDQIQLEAGAFATSPILTYGTGASRGTDVFYITGLGSTLTFPFVVTTRGAIGGVIESKFPAWMFISDGTGSNSFQHYKATATNTPYAQTTSGGGSSLAPLNPALLPDVTTTISSLVTDTGARSSRDGMAVAALTRTNNPYNRVDIGGTLGTNGPMNGYLEYIRIKPGTATDAELMANSVGAGSFI